MAKDKNVLNNWLPILLTSLISVTSWSSTENHTLRYMGIVSGFNKQQVKVLARGQSFWVNKRHILEKDPLRVGQLVRVSVKRKDLRQWQYIRRPKSDKEIEKQQKEALKAYRSAFRQSAQKMKKSR